MTIIDRKIISLSCTIDSVRNLPLTFSLIKKHRRSICIEIKIKIRFSWFFFQINGNHKNISINFHGEHFDNSDNNRDAWESNNGQNIDANTTESYFCAKISHEFTSKSFALHEGSMVLSETILLGNVDDRLEINVAGERETIGFDDASKCFTWRKTRRTSSVSVLIDSLQSTTTIGTKRSQIK